MMTPTVAGWGFCFTTLPAPLCTSMRTYLLYNADIALSSLSRTASGNLHHRMAGHNSVVISPHPGPCPMAPKPERSIGRGHKSHVPRGRINLYKKVLLNVFHIRILAKKARRKEHAHHPASPGNARYQPAFLYFLQVRDTPKTLRHDTPIWWHTALALGAAANAGLRGWWCDCIRPAEAGSAVSLHRPCGSRTIPASRRGPRWLSVRFRHDQDHLQPVPHSPGAPGIGHGGQDLHQARLAPSNTPTTWVGAGGAVGCISHS